MAESVRQNQPNTVAILEDLTLKMAQALSQNQTQIPTMIHESTATHIGIKLYGTNYALWSQIVEMYISGKDMLGYINGDLPQPEPGDPTFRKWRTENSIVKGWLINSMDSSLIGNFIRFATAKEVCDSIATTFFDGTDTAQVYGLKRCVIQMHQSGGSIESYYHNLQGLWREIEFRRPNPMKCADDIKKYNTLLQEDRVHTFLDGLDDRLDKIRSDVLQLKPFPTLEQAYAFVRREDTRQTIMLTDVEHTTGAVMAAKRIKNGLTLQSTLHRAKQGTSLSRGGKSNFSSKTKETERTGSGCAHCGNKKHTHGTCFELHGYPEWWAEFKARKQKETAGGIGRAAMENAEHKLTFALLVESNYETTTTTENQCKNGCHDSSALHVFKEAFQWLDCGFWGNGSYDILSRWLCQNYGTKADKYIQC